jgi:uncharacterized protein YpuA (DUF1002 family)
LDKKNIKKIIEDIKNNLNFNRIFKNKLLIIINTKNKKKDDLSPDSKIRPAVDNVIKITVTLIILLLLTLR